MKIEIYIVIQADRYRLSVHNRFRIQWYIIDFKFNTSITVIHLKPILQ